MKFHLRNQIDRDEISGPKLDPQISSLWLWPKALDLYPQTPDLWILVASLATETGRIGCSQSACRLWQAAALLAWQLAPTTASPSGPTAPHGAGARENIKDAEQTLAYCMCLSRCLFTHCPLSAHRGRLLPWPRGGSVLPVASKGD